MNPLTRPDLTPTERQTLELLREGPLDRDSLPESSQRRLPRLVLRRLVECIARGAGDIASWWQLTDAGRAALAGEAGAARPPDDPLASDVPDPEAWAALLRAPGAYDGVPGWFEVRRFMGKWQVLIVRHGHNPCRSVADGINDAIRAAVAQAEGREGQP